MIVAGFKTTRDVDALHKDTENMKPEMFEPFIALLFFVLLLFTFVLRDQYFRRYAIKG